MEARPRIIKVYKTKDGKIPYEDWFLALNDRRTKAVILSRIDRVRLGNFGNCRSVGSGVYELKIFHGPGFRVYFALEAEQVVLLLCAGDKSTQRVDIARAQELFREFKENAN